MEVEIAKQLQLYVENKEEPTVRKTHRPKAIKAKARVSDHENDKGVLGILL